MNKPIAEVISSNEDPQGWKLKEIDGRMKWLRVGDYIYSPTLMQENEKLIKQNALLKNSNKLFAKRQKWWNDKMVELETKLTEAQEISARNRNALVGIMACTLRADFPADVYDTAEKALKGMYEDQNVGRTP